MANRKYTAREKIYDMLMEFVSTDEEFGFCNSCPELRYEDDLGCWDCPNGLAVDSCEYSPTVEINALADKVIDVLENARP